MNTQNPHLQVENEENTRSPPHSDHKFDVQLINKKHKISFEENISR